MAGEVSTPNVGLQVPGFDQSNWQVPTNFNWNLLDLILGGTVQIPAINVVTLTAQNFNLPSVIASIAAAFVGEGLAVVTPGTVYSCTFVPIVVFGVYMNGLFQRKNSEYSISGNQLTFTSTVASTDILYITYLH